MKAVSHRDYNFLLKLSKMYDKEAVKCKRNGEILASCVMYAASMEASILAIALVYDEDLERTRTYRKRHEPDLRKWELITLLDLARELKWIPSKLPLGHIARTSGVGWGEAAKRGDVGYYADAVREIRDLIHPGRYVRLWPGVKITREHVATVEEAVEVVHGCLEKKVHDSLREYMSGRKK